MSESTKPQAAIDRLRERVELVAESVRLDEKQIDGNGSMMLELAKSLVADLERSVGLSDPQKRAGAIHAAARRYYHFESQGRAIERLYEHYEQMQQTHRILVRQLEEFEEETTA